MNEPLTVHPYDPVRVAGVQNGQAVHLLRLPDRNKAICGTESNGPWRKVSVASDKTCMACWAIASTDRLAKIGWIVR